MTSFSPPQGSAPGAAAQNAGHNAAEAASFQLSGRLKWFNRSKGFGFIVADDGGGDVFLPLTVLERSGHGDPPEGATLTVETVQGAKGRAAVQILALDVSTATPSAPRAPREGRPRHGGPGGGPGGGHGAGHGSAYGAGRGGGNGHDGSWGAPREASSGAQEALDGTVKWYDPARGFGFVLASDGGKDVFVHITTLRRSGLEQLAPGQPVRMKVSQAPRGREAASVELL